jgi:hypothetical protein
MIKGIVAKRYPIISVEQVVKVIDPEGVKK